MPELSPAQFEKKTKEIDMKRSFLTLGASVLALAMTGGSARRLRAPQVVDDSIGRARARWRSTPPCGL